LLGAEDTGEAEEEEAEEFEDEGAAEREEESLPFVEDEEIVFGAEPTASTKFVEWWKPSSSNGPRARL
jgi:hypothetical protein